MYLHIHMYTYMFCVFFFWRALKYTNFASPVQNILDRRGHFNIKYLLIYLVIYCRIVFMHSCSQVRFLFFSAHIWCFMSPVTEISSWMCVAFVKVLNDLFLFHRILILFTSQHRISYLWKCIIVILSAQTVQYNLEKKSPSIRSHYMKQMLLSSW
jgi:hypothetical protein